ncbi:Coenzyme F420 hydrogenase/dehydrogenase, beta subunit C-terminal domain [Roseofilum sp. BLCC_M91]|uniref:Coenzyme F420 hydrogenase/dehydrogenase, beta subunit C-terminal domain n=1 Tax=Roseofilum halophilum BLCC-M91 TaxID=3022259 RepID=A0ABT7BHJ9_9CYAN|nr:Coenzyme F420 hydrogenase/dehydrogenase, beta subunit C-terminal domain [Roseofilum halophilum]MDJ1178664.1 Coenzyme F420 hydrogenase/dehydrogenase, beta subunit C-terminal domain [Roseofilum halophilum BLCC-M91]
MNKNSHKQDKLSLDEIVTAGLCMGCGLCRSIAGSERVEIAMTPEGRERPIALSPLDEKTLEAIDATCPGIRVPSAEPESIPEGAETDILWGPATQMAIGYATDPEIRHRGSSGGVLTALATYLLESKEVDFILHVAASKERPIVSEPRLSFDAVSVLEASGSRYGPGAPLANFMEVLDFNRPFAVVGKPCDITAMRNLERRDPRVKKLMRYCLSLICGGMSDLSKILSALDQFGIRESELRSFRYRGYGNPGLTRMETKDDKTFALTYNDLWADEANWGTQPRCKICPDAVGEVADIVAADCWPGASPTGEDEGFNAIVVRTKRGQELFEKAMADGVLTTIREITFRDLDRFQPHKVRQKKAAWARFAGMRAAGLPVPNTEGLRLEELAREQGWKKLLAQARGARDRVKTGRLGEPSATREPSKNDESYGFY